MPNEKPTPILSSLTAHQPDQDPGRGILDYAKTRTALYDNVARAFTDLGPIQAGSNTLTIQDVAYEEDKPVTLQQERQALLDGQTLTRRLKGTYIVRDPQNNVLSKTTTTLAHVPHITRNGTFIARGNAYSLIHQMRLRPGVYHRRRASGEATAQFNAAPGSTPFSIDMAPSSGVFTLVSGRARIPLYTALTQGLGVPEEQLEQAWGTTLTQANKSAAGRQADVLGRLAKTMTRGKFADGQSEEAAREAVVSAFGKIPLHDPVARRNLEGFLDSPADHPVTGVDGHVLLASTRKLLALNKGEVEDDDRDAVYNQQVVGPEDLFAERVKLDAGKHRLKLAYALRRDPTRKIQSGVFSRQVMSALRDTRLGQMLEQVNPLEVMDAGLKVVRTGEGGMSSDAVPVEARNVQPSQLGFIDLVRSAESASIGLDVRFARNVRKDENGLMRQRFLDLRTNKPTWLSPDDMYGSTVALPGELEGKELVIPPGTPREPDGSVPDAVWAKLLTDPAAAWQPKSMVLAVVKGKARPVARDQVTHALQSGDDMFSALTNATPGLSGIKGGRALMSGKMMTQAAPLAEPESPFVQALVDGGTGESYEEQLGNHAGAVRTAGGGKVLEVTADRIVVAGPDGKPVEHELYNNFPLNRKSQLHNTALVKPGDEVKPGQLLARSNFTDTQGRIALGRNLRVGMVVTDGNFEDAIVISETAARKLGGTRTLTHKADPSLTQVAVEKFAGLFPGKYTRAQLDKLDERGIIKAGVQVQPGDPLILGYTVRSAQDAQAVLGHAKEFKRDATVTWDKNQTGTVVGAGSGKDRSRVEVSYVHPVEVGDKLSARWGNKGIIGCYDEATEVFTSDGWVPWPQVTEQHKFACLIGGKTEFHPAQELVSARFDGELYGATSRDMDYLVTGNHRMWCRIDHYRGESARYAIRRADEVHATDKYHLGVAPGVIGNPERDTVDLSYLRDPTLTSSRRGKPTKVVFDAGDFAELLGWFLSEGSTSFHRSKKAICYKTQISQSREAHPVQCARIEALLTRMGFGWRYGGAQYTFANKAVWAYMKQFGLSRTKFIPPEVFSEWGPAAQRRLLDGLIAGDGSDSARISGGISRAYESASPRLAEDVVRLMTLHGYNARVSVVVRDPEGANVPGYKVTACDTNRTELGLSREHYYRKQYSGMVYCAQVPGGLVFVRRNARPFWCGNSIVADHQMPHDAQGQPIEVALNPLGVISRGNPAQLSEMALGKIAKLTGQPIKVPNFSAEDRLEWTLEQLKKHNLEEQDELTDPTTNSKSMALTGYQYIQALHHTSDSKLSARGTGSYSMDESPAKGGFGGSKRIGGLELSGLLSHGATEYVKDAFMTRGQRNDDFWARYKSGDPVEVPKTRASSERFLAFLAGAGVRTERSGSHIRLGLMSDKDIDTLAGDREITSPEALDLRTGNPIKGGLFDLGTTGGQGGQRWGKVTLTTPVINPLMKQHVARVLNLKDKELDELYLSEDGPQKIQQKLKELDLPREIKRHQLGVTSTRGTEKNSHIKALRLLTGLQKNGTQPESLMLTKIPVLPPRFRPVALSDGKEMTSHANLLYSDLIHANNNMKELATETTDLAVERKNLEDAVRAVVGLGDPVNPDHRREKVHGLLAHVFGKGSPKLGDFQRKVLGTTVNTTGRGVIFPDNTLDVDEAGVPEEMAWGVFQPQILRKLAQTSTGIPRMELARMVEKRLPQARKALEAVIAENPVVVTRAPVWHKFGVMGFKPRLIPGNSISLPPLVYAGFGGDNDGDAVTVHAPISAAAKAEVYSRLLPSKNLLAPGSYTAQLRPSQEYQLGLYQASRSGGKDAPVKFKTMKDAKAALANGQIKYDTPIEIEEKK